MRFPIFILSALLLCVPIASEALAQAIYGGRNYSAPVCSNPNCEMCNYIRAQLSSAYQSTQVPVVVQSEVPTTEITYELVQVPVVTKVKRCNGVTCSYEDVTTYRTERRPVRNAVKAVRDVADAATPRVDMLRVTELAPTPMDAVVAMLSVANPTKTEVLYDLGCGDGRVLVNASATYGCRAVGVELNPVSFKAAADLVDAFGLSDSIRIYQGDVLSYSYHDADVVTMYLYPELIAKVLPKLRKGTRVVSYLHSLPGGTKVTSGGYVFYTLTVN